MFCPRRAAAAKRRLAALLATLACSTPRSLLAEEPPPIEGSVGTAIDDNPEEHRFVSLMMSPVHLLGPVAAFFGEIALVDRFAAGAWLAAGAAGAKDNTTYDAIRLPFFEAGLQGRYYLLGSFKSSFHGSFELGYTHSRTDQLVTLGFGNTSQGVYLQPMLGFKLTPISIFTFDIDMGVRVVAIKTPVSDPTPESAKSEVDMPPRALFALRTVLGVTF